MAAQRVTFADLMKLQQTMKKGYEGQELEQAISELNAQHYIHARAQTMKVIHQDIQAYSSDSSDNFASPMSEFADDDHDAVSKDLELADDGIPSTGNAFRMSREQFAALKEKEFSLH